MQSKRPFALAVDDEPSDLENVRHVLADAGYHVLTASDANSAMEIFQRHADHIEILVTDVAMSPVGGCDLAAALVKLKPDLHVTFVSAYSGSLAFQYNEVLTFPFALVAKPFSAQDLLKKIRPEREISATCGISRGLAGSTCCQKHVCLMGGYPTRPHCGQAQLDTWAPPETPHSGQ